jgi:hypothetical protein
MLVLNFFHLISSIIFYFYLFVKYFIKFTCLLTVITLGELWNYLRCRTTRGEEKGGEEKGGEEKGGEERGGEERGGEERGGEERGGEEVKRDHTIRRLRRLRRLRCLR